jgi:hypothetical protein
MGIKRGTIKKTCLKRNADLTIERMIGHKAKEKLYELKVDGTIYGYTIQYDPFEITINIPKNKASFALGLVRLWLPWQLPKTTLIARKQKTICQVIWCKNRRPKID